MRPGIDVLLSDSAHLISGKRIGLLTNQTGVDARGVPTLDRLRADSTSSRMVAIFAPEHHFAASLRPGETFGDTVDAVTHLPIYSLYGERRAPTAEQLATLDVLIVDLQDVGVRTFTYVTTMVYAMRAAAGAGKRVIVLDRPNPIGCAIQGPVLDTANTSFIGYLPVPLRHGMTIGELARFANAELRIGADLVVVPVQGWRRCEWFDQTGLPWVAPSPNLPTLESVAWYPGTVLFEATNLSVGRGTDAPFRQVGAPWLNVPVGRTRTEFTPRDPGDQKFAGQACVGVALGAANRAGNPIRESLRLLAELQRANRDSLRVDERGMRIRLGVAGRTSGTAAELARFRRKARPFFLYR